MSYNKASYDRTKGGNLLRSSGEAQKEAFDSIRAKWSINDRAISKLLRDFTVTEILEGDIDEMGFVPGPRLIIEKYS